MLKNRNFVGLFEEGGARRPIATEINQITEVGGFSDLTETEAWNDEILDWDVLRRASLTCLKQDG